MTLRTETDTAAPPEWFTRALAAPVSVRTVLHDGATLAYRRWDAPGGRGVILVHGGAAHARWWDHIGPLLAAGRPVVALDLSGHGDSGRHPSYSFDEWAREILAVAADAGLDRPTVIGHSMGGLVTLRLAELAGSRIGGAVIIDSPVRDLAPEEQAARGGGRVFRQLRVYPTKEEAMARFRPVPDQPVLGYVAEHVAATSVRAVDGGWTWKWDPPVFGREQPRPPQFRLDCRVALFRAEHGIMSAEMSDMLYDRLGRMAPVIEIPAAGHHIMLDQPLALVAAIRTLLSDWDHSLPALPH